MKCKKHPAIIGLKQALGVAIYCGLVSAFFRMMEQADAKVDNFVMATVMLLILVFSAAITGALVFGYPVYLIINKEVKKGLAVLGHTFLFLLLIIIIVLLFLLV